MSDPSPKGLGGHASGILSGVAAAATVVAATIGVLNQFGIIGGPDASSPNSKNAAVVEYKAAPQAGTVAAAMRQPAPATTISSGADVPVTGATERPRRMRRKQLESANPAPAASTSVAMAAPDRPSSLSGAWRDAGIGACHLINQAGAKFEVVNYDPATGEMMSHGAGTIDGNHVAISYPHGATTLDLHISPNGRTMFGKIVRVNGTHRVMWNYIGPVCEKKG